MFAHESTREERRSCFLPFISTEEFFLDGSEVKGLAPLACGCCCCRLDAEDFLMPLLLLLPPPPTGTCSVEESNGETGGARRSEAGPGAAAGAGGAAAAASGGSTSPRKDLPTSCNAVGIVLVFGTWFLPKTQFITKHRKF